MDLYFPAEYESDQMARMSRADAATLVLSELEAIASRPATEVGANLSLLARSAIARKAGVTTVWLRQMHGVARSAAERKARQQAIERARSSGALSASDQMWAKVAAQARYALPEWVVLVEQAGCLRLADIRGAAAIGPAVYPVAELENGTIRLAGWDRWGRSIRDLALPLDVLENPKKCQAMLAGIGARMDAPALWCVVVREILGANDLRVADPEPAETEAEELDRIRRAVRAVRASEPIAQWLDADGVEYCAVAAFTRLFGRTSTATRRRWAETGWIRRGLDGRLTPLARHGDWVGRAFAFSEVVFPMH